MKRKLNERGNAVVEVALIIPVMALLALGFVDFAMAIQQNMLTLEAAQEGALYGSFNNYLATQTSNIQTAATTAGGATGMTAVATYFCTCTPGGSTVACTSACGTDQPMMYFQVATALNINSVFHYFSLPSSFALQSTTTMPVY